MKLTIDTQTDSFREAVDTVYAAYGYERDWDWDDEAGPAAGARSAEPGGGAAEAPTSGVLPGGWTEKRLQRWVDYLTPNALTCVRFIAQHAPEVSFDDVAAHLGQVLEADGPVDGRTLGGAMSSGGHALRQVGKDVKAQPIDRDWARRVYAVDPRIAAILIAATQDRD